MQQQTSQHDLVLTATMQAGADALTIRYTVLNRGTRDLYLFNHLYDTYDGRPGYRVEPDLAAIEFRDGEVVVSKKLVPVPDDMDVEIDNLPCVTLVEPGTQVSETFKLKLPLQRRTCYERGEGTRPGTPSKQAFDPVPTLED